MNRPRISGYQPVHGSGQNQADLAGIISKLPTLTKIGGGCLIAGKFVGLLAIPAVFIPALHSIGIILIITWGSLVFASIVLCSYEHFRQKKTSGSREQKLALIQELLAESPNLREELASTLELEEAYRNNSATSREDDEDYELPKVIQLHLGSHR